jgi:hypothetical protein
MARKLDRDNLYAAARFLSLSNKRALGLKLPVTVYVQDPRVAARNADLGLRQLWVDWEPGLGDGPTSARIAVVDYDESTDTRHPAARWDKDSQRFVGTEDPTSVQFHQVNAWAIIQNILAFFEDPWVLGRAVPWAFEGNRLTVRPHAGHARNAFYSRHTKSLQFYYCGTADEPVHTCLSHDVIAHETGHAILDGIRPYYHEISSIQTAAFHEYMADLTAILSALRNNDVRQVVADSSGGDLSKETVISNLAEEFGWELGGRADDATRRNYLRTARNELSMDDIETSPSPHRCSQVLTGAMFDILIEIANGHLERGLSPRRALWYATDRITRLALQPLDFCPPVDIQFIDYARAVLRAYELYNPVRRKRDQDADDGEDFPYSDLIEDVFARRGLGDLRADEGAPRKLEFRRYDVQRLSSSRTAAYLFLHENRSQLCIPPGQDLIVADLYDTSKETRVTGERYRLPREIIVEYVWREDVPLQGRRFGQLAGRCVSLLCGGTLVFDSRGNVLSFVRKPGTSPAAGEQDREMGQRRRERLLAYVAGLVAMGRIRLAGEPGAESLEDAKPAVVARQVGATLRLEVPPHLRHASEA